jgi:hypothetical protein
VRPVTREPVAGWIRIGDHTVGTSPGGGFRFLWLPGEPLVTLEFGDSAQLGRRSIGVPGPFTGVRDLGELELAPVRLLRLRVRDSSGAPVAGAAAAITNTSSESSLTDAEGVSSIAVNAEGGELRVAKLGYTTAVVALGPESGGTHGLVDVELAPGNRLSIDVRLPDGSPPTMPHTVVRLISTDPPFAGDRPTPDPLLQYTGVSTPYLEGDLWYFPDVNGRIGLGGFKPGAQVAIELRGNSLGETLDESFVVMEAAGSKTIVLRSQLAPRPFTSLVRSQDGEPVHGATCTITGEQAYTRNLGTDDQGRVTFNGIFADSIPMLQISADGFVPVTLRNVPVPGGGAERVFTLVRAREVTIEVVDERGRALDSPAEVVVRPAGGPDEWENVEHIGPGQYLARGLPPGDVEIVVTVGVSHTAIFHDARAPVARVVVPYAGQVALSWRRDEADPPSSRIRIVSSPAGRIAFIDVPDGVGEHLLEALLPPGSYLAVAEGFDEATEEWTEIGGAVTFTIAAYDATLVELTR